MALPTCPRRWRRAWLIALLFVAAEVEAQQVPVGQKLLGTLGLHAGSQPDAGLYLAARYLRYRADELVDRSGASIPVGLELDALGASVGLGVTIEVARLSTWVNAAVGISAAHASLETDRPEASLDRAGLGDLFVQPLKLGWRTAHLDLVAGYAFYAPTGSFTPGGARGGVGRGHWTHEVSAGGAVYFDRAQTWHLTALASLDVNTRKREIDITRGSTLQVQGGAGKRLLGIFEVGLAGYALWQVSDDAGSDLPPVLRGARDRAFGLGPELGLAIPAIRSRLTARYEYDFASRSRPQGQIFFFGLTSAAWTPSR